MSQITTHILDTSIGKPASGVSVVLKKTLNGESTTIGSGVTNNDGRINNLSAGSDLESGAYELIFMVEDYFLRENKDSFYSKIHINFKLGALEHYHVPLLLNPYGYSTYRGS